MTHANAPLTPAGRLRLIERCQHRPVAHVAAEAGVSRACLSKWKRLFDELGEAGLVGRSSAPHRSPTQTPDEMVDLIESWRRLRKWTVRQIGRELIAHGQQGSVATTIGLWSRARAFFAAHGITRIVRVITDNGANDRAAAFYRIITATAPRHRRIRPYTPRHNGKGARYNRILVERFPYSRL